MAQPAFDGAIGRGQRLGDDLAAEDPHRGLAARAEAPEQVHFQLLDVQQIEQALRLFVHVFSVSCEAPFIRRAA